MVTLVPVIEVASGSARNATAPAISAGDLGGCREPAERGMAPDDVAIRAVGRVEFGVGGPGLARFTVIARGPSSRPDAVTGLGVSCAEGLVDLISRVNPR
jgi:hypothetical protein